MKYIICLFILFISISVSAQNVERNGKTYEVKNERIFLDGKDVTDTLKAEDKSAILKLSEKAKTEAQALKEYAKAEKEAEKLIKEKEKAEKAHKKAVKAQKKAEKELKQQEKAQKRFDKATKDLSKAQKKYDKLKRKGKLSPNDEADWLKKLEKLKSDLDKAKRKL